MRRPVQLATAVSLVLLLFPGEVFADSDGYYCVGPGYMAYEVRGWDPGEPHLLKVVRFGGGQVQEAGQVELQDFQPHELVCEDHRVRISGWDRAYIAYTVDVSTPDGPTVVDRTEDPSKDFSPSLFTGEMANLGSLAFPGVTELESPEADYRYQLEVTTTSRGVEGGIEHRTVSSVVALDPEARELMRLVVFEGSRLETIHLPAW